MARLPKRHLLELVEDALSREGWGVLRLPAEVEHPARYRIFRDDGEAVTIRVYIWNISHGGGANRPAHEYRIQVTGVDRFEAEPGGKTLILGWHDELSVFAAFDFNHHQGVLGASPSIQIGEEALTAAAENGIAPHNRGNGELAIAVRPDVFGFYVQNMTELQQTGEIGDEIALFSRVGADPDDVAPEEVEGIVAEPRRRAIMTTLRLLRDVRFRGRVLSAYRHRCAFCGVQLNLLDAAHVLPVGHPRSTDQVDNGVALCALHHRAYDRALVTFDADYRILIGGDAVAALEQEDRAEGLGAFREALRDNILLPGPAGLRPRRELVQAANEFRGWTL